MPCKQNARQLLFINATLLIAPPACKPDLLQMNFLTLSSLPSPCFLCAWTLPAATGPRSWPRAGCGRSLLPAQRCVWEGCSEQLKLSREGCPGTETPLCFFGSGDKK